MRWHSPHLLLLVVVRVLVLGWVRDGGVLRKVGGRSGGKVVPGGPGHVRWVESRRHVTVPVPVEYAAELAATASALVAPGKGLLASDESPQTLNGRLEAAGLVNSEDTRRSYREALYTSPDLGTYVSGCILSADMLFEETNEGTPFVDLLNASSERRFCLFHAGQRPVESRRVTVSCR